MQKRTQEQVSALVEKITAAIKDGMPMKEACKKFGMGESHYWQKTHKWKRAKVSSPKKRAYKSRKEKIAPQIITFDKKDLTSLNEVLILKKQLAAAFTMIETLKPQIE